MLTTAPLHSVQTATTVRVRNSQVSMTDSPFAETKEQLAGFYLTDAKGLNEAARRLVTVPFSTRGTAL